MIRQSRATTHAIESRVSRTRNVTRNVNRWPGRPMVQPPFRCSVRSGCPLFSTVLSCALLNRGVDGLMVRRSVACLVGMTALVVGGLPSCGGSSIQPQPPPAKTCSYSLALSSANFSASGGQATATVTAATTNAADCSWTARTDQSWLTISGTTSGNGSGSFTYTASAINSTQPPPDAVITVSWSGSSTGSTGMTVSHAALQALSATFVVQSTATVPKADTCDVTAGQKVKCIFDASGSNPASLLTSYQFSIAETKESFQKSADPQTKEPTLPTCNLFNIIKNSNGAFPVTMTVTVTSSDGRSAVSQPKTVSFQKNGAC